MPKTREFEKELLGHVPALYRFAMSMSRTASDAEDLTQETLKNALEFQSAYQPDTNMKAWLFRIQVNINLNQKRKIYRQKALSEANGLDPDYGVVMPSQVDRLIFNEAGAAIAALPIDQKQALFLVVYDGKSYEEAAQILDCEVGTVKSRVSRARARVAEAIDYEQTGRAETREMTR